MKEHFTIHNAHKVLWFVAQSQSVYASIDAKSKANIFLDPELNLETARVLEEGGFLEGTILVQGGVPVVKAIVRLTNSGNELLQILEDKDLRDTLKDMTIETAYEVGKQALLKKAKLQV